MADAIEAEHLDGVPWFQAPLPPVEHTCWAQTYGWYAWITRVERCACGAIRTNGGEWREVNERQPLEARVAERAAKWETLWRWLIRASVRAERAR